MSRSRRAPKGTTLFVLLLLGGCARVPPPPSQPSPLLTRVMPVFEGDTLSHNHFYTAQGTGYPMVVKFFSSKSTACRQTLVALQHVYEDSSDLVVVGISEDDSAVDARHLVDELGLHFPVILDEGGRISKQYQVTDTPTTFVVTAHGKVSWVGGAGATEDAVRAAVHVARD